MVQIRFTAIIALLLLAVSTLVAQPTVTVWGDSGNTDRTLPSGLGGATAISVGNGFGLALMPGGTVKAWGNDADGQIDVPGGLSGVIAISAGWNHSLALTSTGTVVAWGNNDYGQTSVPGGLTGVTAISAGDGFSLALTSTGQIVGWGNNSYGQTTPPAIAGTVTSISAGGLFAMALTSSGHVVAWGDNSLGETNLPGFSTVTAISAGFAHGVALQSDGSVVTWGFYSGIGTQTPEPGGLTATAISAGYSHDLAIKTDGTIAAWGYGGNGQTTVAPGLTGTTAISAGNTFDLALAVAPAITVTIIQRLDGGTVPNGTVVELRNNDNTMLSPVTKTTTVGGVAAFSSPPAPTAPNTSYEVVVCPPTGQKGLNAFKLGVSYGPTTIYYTAVLGYVTQATTVLSPVASATCKFDTVSVSTATNGHSPVVWLPDATYAVTFSMSPGVPCNTHITLGASSSSNLVAEVGYTMINARLTRVYFTARNTNGSSFIPKAGTWSVSPGAYSTPVNGQVISPSFWLPNGSYTGTLAGATKNGSSSFNVGSPLTATGQRVITVN